MIIFGFVLLVLVVLAILAITSIFEMVRENQIGIAARFGALGEIRESGLHFNPLKLLPGCRIVKRPLTLFDLRYKPIKVLTAAGEIAGAEYHSIMVTFTVIGYAKFPRDAAGLAEAIRAGISETKTGLIDITQESVKTSVTAVASARMWPEIFNDLLDLAQSAEEVLVEESPLTDAGFDDDEISLGIETASLPPELEKELVGLETAKLSVEVGQYKAQAMAFKLVGPVLYSMAEAKGMNLEELQAEVDTDASLQAELREYASKVNRELEQARLGAFFRFKVDGGDGIEKGIMDIFALVKAFSKGDIGKLIKDATNSVSNSGDDSPY